jgi:hypothetical protein
MDGSIDPLPTYSNGKVEVLTITNAFFAQSTNFILFMNSKRTDGWLYTGVGQRGGATLMQEFKDALKYRPHVTNHLPVSTCLQVLPSFWCSVNGMNSLDKLKDKDTVLITINTVPYSSPSSCVMITSFR